MSDDLISVIDVARQHGKRKATVFKVLKRLGITPAKQRSSSSRNQFVACITHDEFRLVAVELQSIVDREHEDESDEFVSADIGVFYLIQLEPELDPGRFKVGFATSLLERLRHLRCSAPFAMVVRSWPCRRLWEKTAIDAVSVGCEQLHTEVFRTGSLDEIIERCTRFFAIMPPVQPSTPNQSLQHSATAASVSGNS